MEQTISELTATLVAIVGAIAAILLHKPPAPAESTAVVEIPAAAPATYPAPAEDSSESIDPAITSLDDLAESEPGPMAEPEMPEPEIALQPQDLQRTTPATAPAAPAQSVEPTPAATEPTPTPQVQIQQPGAGDVPLLRDLPAGYRADFPALSVEVHVYDRLPEKRWVMVGSRRYREGEVLSEGPRVASITEDGIVFDYRGQQSLYPITR